MTKMISLILMIGLISSCSLYFRDCDFWSISSNSIKSENFEFSICRSFLKKTNSDLSTTEKADRILKTIEWQGADYCDVVSLNTHQHGPKLEFKVECERIINIDSNYIKNGELYFVGAEINNRF